MNRYIVHVRHDDDNYATFLGVFLSHAAARRKADAINRRLPDDVEHGAWAYVQTLYGATVPASDVAAQAMGLQ